METEFIDFESLRKFINIEDISLLALYLREVYKDLSDRDKGDSNKKKGISRNSFLGYIKLPVFIGEKLFNSFDVDGDHMLSIHEFVDGLTNLYTGDFYKTIKLIFALLDFDKDGIIKKGDAKILLSYLPLKTENKTIEYKFQMASFAEIEELIKSTFLSENLKINDFIKITETKKSDIFLQILCFLYFKRPFSDDNINMLKSYKKKSNNLYDSPANSPSNSPARSPGKNLPSPNKKSLFSPVENVLKLNLVTDEENQSQHSKSPSPKNSPKRNPKNYIPNEIANGNIDLIRMDNTKIQVQKSDDINSNIKYSKNVYNSPSSLLRRKDKNSLPNVNTFSLEDNLVQMDFPEDEKAKISEEYEGKNQKVSFEDWIYKLSESNKVKKYWLVASGKDIYYYRNEKKEELLGMHNLSGCYISDIIEKKVNGEKLFNFSIQFTSKTRNYYLYKKKKCIYWSKILKDAIGYKSFFDFYEMREAIGEGKFGLVKLGVHKKTKEKVAIKIIKKESMTTQDFELVKGEIDIMKLCKHPNIVTLYDHFENNEYIFIIMEYLSGGDLETHLMKTKFRTSEEKAARIMHQLSSGIQYLHKYGVLHRDLKPENVMLSDKSDEINLKIMDFGLSKIMGPEERLADGYGTLSFVAPEVLVRRPYNKQIDIWSLGVTLYYMLTGTLPFDDEHDNEEKIAKLVVFSQVEFPSKFWGKKSADVIDLIKKCLIKNPEERIKIGEILDDKWVNENFKKKEF